MTAEAECRPGLAADLFLQAWESSTNDYERCIAAHYVARQQPSVEEALRWNHLSLECARAVNDPRAEEFYPSLYLNVGKAHEELGNMAEAKAFYERAASHEQALAKDPYRNLVRGAITRGLQRAGTQSR